MMGKIGNKVRLKLEFKNKARGNEGKIGIKVRFKNLYLFQKKEGWYDG